MDTKMIGGKIVTARKNKNLSQAQLAQLLFISPQAVGKWERGESIPDIITFNRLAEILAVDLNYFSENFSTLNDGAADKNNTAGTIEPERIAQEAARQAGDPERPLLTNFSGSDLAASDFAGITAHNRRFDASALRNADFSGADLTGSSFRTGDLREADFTGTNLTDCTLSIMNLTNANFNKTILVRTEFSKSELHGVKFTDAKLIDVKLTMIDLRKTQFVSCVFDGVDFVYSDLRGLCLDGQAFTGVTFQKTALNEVSFKGATLKNVSFRSPYALTNKYYRSIKTISFDGAKMDKLTYAALKGLGADLSTVTFI